MPAVVVSAARNLYRGVCEKIGAVERDLHRGECMVRASWDGYRLCRGRLRRGLRNPRPRRGPSVSPVRERQPQIAVR